MWRVKQIILSLYNRKQSCKTGDHAFSLEFLSLDKRNVAVNLGLENLREEKTKLPSKFKAVNLLGSICCIGADHVVERKAWISNFLIGCWNWNKRRQFSLDFVKNETVANSEDPVSHAGYLVCSCLQLLNFDWVLACDCLVRQLNNEIVQALEHTLGVLTWCRKVKTQELLSPAVSTINNAVKELEGLVDLAIASWRGV